jgi:hypothetical protein
MLVPDPADSSQRPDVRHMRQTTDWRLREREHVSVGEQCDHSTSPPYSVSNTNSNKKKKHQKKISWARWKDSVPAGEIQVWSVNRMKQSAREIFSLWTKVQNSRWQRPLFCTNTSIAPKVNESSQRSINFGQWSEDKWNSDRLGTTSRGTKAQKTERAPRSSSGPRSPPPRMTSQEARKMYYQNPFISLHQSLLLVDYRNRPGISSMCFINALRKIHRVRDKRNYQREVYWPTDSPIRWYPH